MDTAEAIERWYSLIGRVVMAAAELEAATGTLLVSVSHRTTERFYAWTLQALCTSCRKALPTVADVSLRERVAAQIADIEAIAVRRNDVVHGWWRIGIDGADALQGRATPKAPSLAVSKVTYEELRLLLVDIEVLRHSTWVLAHDVADRKR